VFGLLKGQNYSLPACIKDNAFMPDSQKLQVKQSFGPQQAGLQIAPPVQHCVVFGLLKAQDHSAPA